MTSFRVIVALVPSVPTLGFVATVTWCQPLTGSTNTPDGPYIYVDDVKTYSGLTSAWSATSTCCSGTTQVVSGYSLIQPEGVPPTPPAQSGETVFYNNDLVTYDVNTATGFTLNLTDLWGNDINPGDSCPSFPSISGLTVNGGEIYFKILNTHESIQVTKSLKGYIYI